MMPRKKKAAKAAAAMPVPEKDYKEMYYTLLNDSFRDAQKLRAAEAKVDELEKENYSLRVRKDAVEYGLVLTQREVRNLSGLIPQDTKNAIYAAKKPGGQVGLGRTETAYERDNVRLAS
jgi:hypothetical protein